MHWRYWSLALSHRYNVNTIFSFLQYGSYIPTSPQIFYSWLNFIELSDFLYYGILTYVWCLYMPRQHSPRVTRKPFETNTVSKCWCQQTYGASDGGPRHHSCAKHIPCPLPSLLIVTWSHIFESSSILTHLLKAQSWEETWPVKIAK